MSFKYKAGDVLRSKDPRAKAPHSIQIQSIKFGHMQDQYRVCFFNTKYNQTEFYRYPTSYIEKYYEIDPDHLRVSSFNANIKRLLD